MYRSNRMPYIPSTQGIRRESGEPGRFPGTLTPRCTAPTNAKPAPDSRESWALGKGYPLAMVYVPDQCWQELYDLQTALVAGTLFKELDKPLGSGKGGCSRE